MACRMPSAVVQVLATAWQHACHLHAQCCAALAGASLASRCLCLLAFLLQALTLAGLGIAGVVQASGSMLQCSARRKLNL